MEKTLKLTTEIIEGETLTHKNVMDNLETIMAVGLQTLDDGFLKSNICLIGNVNRRTIAAFGQACAQIIDQSTDDSLKKAVFLKTFVEVFSEEAAKVRDKNTKQAETNFYDYLGKRGIPDSFIKDMLDILRKQSKESCKEGDTNTSNSEATHE